MCAGVELRCAGGVRRVYFPAPGAALPVLHRDGSETTLTWGARGDEYAGGRRWPRGGWARLDSVRAGKWDAYRPLPVKIPARGYMEKDADGRSHWFALEPGRYLQGLVAHLGGERRVYVVTVEPPPERAHVHDRWPRIVGDSDARAPRRQ
jgi:hypothetical protein